MTLVLPDREPTAVEVELIKATTAVREKELLLAEQNYRILSNQVEEIEHRWGLEKSSNINNRTLGFAAAVNSDTVEQALEILSRWHRLDPSKEITVRFTSPGGDVVAGLMLYDAMRGMVLEGTPITTVALGMAASMAAVLLQAGSVRVMGPTSRILIHEGDAQMKGKIRDIREQEGFSDALLDTIMSLLATRSGKLTKAELKRKVKTGDWWLTADKAVQYGFADRIGWH